MPMTRCPSGLGRISSSPRVLAMLLLLVAVTSPLLVPVVAGASCASGVAEQDAIQSAPFVFVGTVTDLSNGGRVATVRVDDIWRGRGIPSSVDVVGTPDLNAAATSVDRTYADGSQYLFVPVGGGPEHFTDNNCTATQLYSANLSALRPVGARGVPARTDSQFPVALAMVIVLVVAGVGGGVVLRRRRQATAT
jgi:hypothetical protein